MQIAVIGGGAMGLLWASLLGLTRKHDLWIAEKNEERYGVMKERGYLCFHPAAGATRKLPVAAVRQIDDLPFPHLDGVIVAVKAYQVDDVLATLLPLLPADVPVLCLANGAGFGGRHLIEIWQGQDGAGRLIAKLSQVFFAVSFQGAYLENPGEVSSRGAGAVYWGSLPSVCREYQPNAAVKEALQVLLLGMEGCSYRPDFPAAMWQKLLVNSVINPLTVLWQIPNGGLADEAITPEQRRIKKCLLAEGIAVAEAYGREILGKGDFLLAAAIGEVLEQTISATAENYSSMYQDVAHHRKTEIDYLNGYLLAWGRRFGVPMPCHQEVYQQVKALFSP